MLVGAKCGHLISPEAVNEPELKTWSWMSCSKMGMLKGLSCYVTQKTFVLHMGDGCRQTLLCQRRERPHLEH